LLAFLSSLLVVDVQQAIGRGVTNVRVNLSTPSFIAAMLVWALMVGTTQFMLQVSDKFGPGNLWRFIRGRYYQPRQEERIFMFLDLKSATTIAEKIGDER